MICNHQNQCRILGNVVMTVSIKPDKGVDFRLVHGLMRIISGRDVDRTKRHVRSVQDADFRQLIRCDIIGQLRPDRFEIGFFVTECIFNDPLRECLGENRPCIVNAVLL